MILKSLYILLSLQFMSCSDSNLVVDSNYELSSLSHDLSYHPYDARVDLPAYIICDSTQINSGRNRLQYIGGTKRLKEDITTKYLYRHEYESFSGYIVVRFLVNCKGKSGRYRVQSLNLDFSPSDAPSDLLNYSLELIRSLDNWTKSSSSDSTMEYSKYINLKLKNGKIEHVLL